MCIHLAAKVGGCSGGQSDGDDHRQRGDDGARRSGVRLSCDQDGLLASTSEVYGDNGTAVCDEYAGPSLTPPTTCTESRKGFGEKICEHYCPKDLTILRFSMPYGPGLPAGRGRAAIINMLHQAVHRKQIPVHQGAERSWCYVTDTVRALRLAITEATPGVFNIGRDDAAVSMLTVAKIACEITGAPLNLIEEVSSSPDANRGEAPVDGSDSRPGMDAGGGVDRGDA